MYRNKQTLGNEKMTKSELKRLKAIILKIETLMFDVESGDTFSKLHSVAIKCSEILEEEK
tara:strand:+ start:204 stop:383 length:180 start_codon:yes stop_codon:yes gene_type:complete